ncbi:zinc finger protein 260-like isoform X1 [Acanthochromis polyacanthus]|uniref:Zinc finger protein 239-like n=1 Tax=Acanthochromis polyacanthus TaxID=80966 RepID=A0A3Q1F0P4_9TELE|nr:zinc finger protein 260-like isoform X1 [Acanthochromis polyacanthus]
MNKLSVPSLLTAAYTAKRRKHKGICEKPAIKKESDRARTRINIGGAFPRWRKLRDLKGFKTDADFASFLLDRYQSDFLATILTPTKHSGDDEGMGFSEVNEIAVEVLDTSPSSPDMRDDISEDDFSHIQNSVIDWTEDKTWAPVEDLGDISTSEDGQTTEEDGYNDDSDDEDYIPPSCVRTGTGTITGAIKPKICPGALQSVSKDETVHDAVDKEWKEQQPVTEKIEVQTEDKSTDELATITDHDCLKHPRKRGAEANYHEEHRPEPQEQDPNTVPTDELESNGETLRSPEVASIPSSSHHKPQEKASVEPEQSQCFRRPKKIYNCSTCGKVFPCNQALKRHLVIHSGKRPFKCFICGRGFTQSGNLKTHMKTHRGELTNWTLVKEKSPIKESPLTVYLCGECGMDFPEKHLLEEHRGSHKKPYACPDCDKTFKNESYLKIHQHVHSGETPYICSECGKSCVTAVLLKKHELTHSGEKNFHCDQCGRAFLQSVNLKEHLKTHTGERPHLCSICGKSYSRAYALKVHLRVHTGEKPYSCEKCGKCFFYSQNYQKHLKTHDKKPKLSTKPLGRPKQQLLVVNNQ